VYVDSFESYEGTDPLFSVSGLESYDFPPCKYYAFSSLSAIFLLCKFRLSPTMKMTPKYDNAKLFLPPPHGFHKTVSTRAGQTATSPLPPPPRDMPSFRRERLFLLPSLPSSIRAGGHTPGHISQDPSLFRPSDQLFFPLFLSSNALQRTSGFPNIDFKISPFHPKTCVENRFFPPPPPPHMRKNKLRRRDPRLTRSLSPSLGRKPVGIWLRIPPSLLQ